MSVSRRAQRRTGEVTARSHKWQLDPLVRSICGRLLRFLLEYPRFFDFSPAAQGRACVSHARQASGIAPGAWSWKARPVAYRTLTLAAFMPLGPVTTSSSTSWPS